jgi:hypothetical protein
VTEFVRNGKGLFITLKGMVYKDQIAKCAEDWI